VNGRSFPSVNVSDFVSEACIAQGFQGGADGLITGVWVSDDVDVSIQGGHLVPQSRADIMAGKINRAYEAGLSRGDADRRFCVSPVSFAGVASVPHPIEVRTDVPKLIRELRLIDTARLCHVTRETLEVLPGLIELSNFSTHATV
jgi:hypothetical protein